MKPIRDRFPRPSEHFWHRILPASTIIMVSLVFLFAIVAWSEPLPGAGSSGSNSPQNPNQTDGLVLGGIVLIIIILGGTLGVLGAQSPATTPRKSTKTGK